MVGNGADNGNKRQSPPHSKDAEEGILTCLLLDPTLMADIVEMITPEDFYYGRCRIVYEAFLTLAARNIAADQITLRTYLQDTDNIEKIGGSAWLVDLNDALPSSVGYRQYARIIREKGILRRLMELTVETQQQCYRDQENIDEFLNLIESRIFLLANRSTKRRVFPMSELVRESLERIDLLRNNQGALLGLPTGLLDLDKALSGLQNSDLIIVAARASVGKTSLVLSIMQYVTTNRDEAKNVPGLIFSLEMSREQVSLRMLCSAGRIDHSRARNGYLNQQELTRLVVAAEKLGEAPIFVEDSPSNTILSICAIARRMKKESGIGIIAVDYLQLIQGNQEYQNDAQKLGDMTLRLKGLARELEIPVILLCQLNRQVEYRTDKRPTLADLRGSGNIEEHADVVLLLYREDYYSQDAKDAGIVEINVAKQRNGPTGITKVAFIKEQMRFANLVEPWQEPPSDDDKGEI